jgi:predicted SnoaL-like aldol condensation-catalyzing enzyme
MGYPIGCSAAQLAAVIWNVLRSEHASQQSFSGFGQPVNWIAADILRIENGILVEHWDVIEDEATRESSKSGLPMFGEKFAT